MNEPLTDAALDCSRDFVEAIDRRIEPFADNTDRLVIILAATVEAMAYFLVEEMPGEIPADDFPDLERIERMQALFGRVLKTRLEKLKEEYLEKVPE
jgi:hypothetical protein